jgi:hypothetical protein
MEQGSITRGDPVAHTVLRSNTSHELYNGELLEADTGQHAFGLMWIY